MKSSCNNKKLRAEEAARLKAEQELLQERQERLQKELLAGTLQVEEKNELLQNIRTRLDEDTESATLKNQVERIIKENDRMDADIELVKANFAEIHPEFFARLQQKANNTLTRLDLKYCSYILMRLLNKGNCQPAEYRSEKYSYGTLPHQTKIATGKIRQSRRSDFGMG